MNAHQSVDQHYKLGNGTSMQSTVNVNGYLLISANTVEMTLD